jgi:GTP-binding protein HflX
MVFNKIDMYRERYYDDLLDDTTKAEIEADMRDRMKHTYGESVFISAHTKEGMDEFRERLTRLIKESYVVRYPHQVKGW